MSVMNDTKLFVIVVTYKGHQWYDRCFTSLRESELPVQTIVIDNASNDGTVEYIREYFPEIHLIESKENLGFGRANNIGMRYALDHGCDYVFLLNQDAWIESNTLSELVRIHQKYPEYGILSPMHLTKEKDHFNILFDDGARNYELMSDFYFGIKKEVYNVQYVNAAAWLMPRATLENIGGFSPIFLQYGEDDDYINRMHFHGISIGLCLNVVMVHDHTSLKNTLTGGKIRHLQSTLFELLDLNKDITIDSILSSYLHKMVKALLKINKVQFMSALNDYRYINSKKREILAIRIANKKMGENWL